MTRYPIAALFLALLVLVGATITGPAQWPGLNDLPYCVQNVFSDCLWECAQGGGCIPCYVGCTDWTCACNQFPAAVSAASSVAVSASGCSNLPTNAASATSIVNAFCGQLLATVTQTGPTGPTAVPTPSSIAVPTPSTSTSTSDTSGGDNLPTESSGPGGGGGGLTSSEKIAIGLGVGIGVPGAIAAIWQMCIWINR